MQKPQAIGPGLLCCLGQFRRRAPDPHQKASPQPSRGRQHVDIQSARDLPLTLKIRMLMDQRGLLRRLPSAHHRVLQRRPKTGRERVPGVTKVVEAEAVRHPDEPAGAAPPPPGVKRRNGVPFSPTNSSPSGPFSAYRSRSRRRSVRRKAGRTPTRLAAPTWCRQEHDGRWSTRVRPSGCEWSSRLRGRHPLQHDARLRGGRHQRQEAGVRATATK